jgi:hypothetical protein
MRVIKPGKTKANMTTKQALDLAVNLAAGHTNRLRSLAKVAAVIHEDLFYKTVGQHPLTIERDLQWAHNEFERVKAAYEDHCFSIGEPAYFTYSED